MWFSTIFLTSYQGEPDLPNFIKTVISPLINIKC